MNRHFRGGGPQKIQQHQKRENQQQNKNEYHHACASVPELDSLFEEASRKRNARRGKLVGKLGPNTGRRKCSQSMSVWTDALLIEDEDILHADNVVFHSGNLADVSDPAR